MTMKEIKGFKVFNPDWTCRNFKYEVGKTFEENITPSTCDRGFHFCKEAKDCFNYYSFNPDNKVAEVIAHGLIDEEGDKCCTNKIEIVREIPWNELLTIVNLGKGNAGLCNTGNRNTGNRNTGDWNTGDWNTGDCNQGDFCSGDFNISDYESGCFCTEEHKIRIFDVESDLTLREWRNSDAYYLLRRIDFRPNEWVCASDMTDEEKAAHPEHETTGGYLKVCDTDKAFLTWWDSLNKTEKGIINKIPNFNAEKFEQLTGIKVK